MYPYSNDNSLFSPNPATPQEKIRTAYNRAFVNWQASWVEMYRDQSFYLNNQWTSEERRYLQQEQRPDYCYNIQRSMINMVGGYERKNRLSTIVQAVENSSAETADLYTTCMYHAQRSGQFPYAFSDAVNGALVTGIGYIGLEMDYRSDPINGDLKYQYHPWNSIITDPFWTKKDFSDCDYLIRRAYMDKRESISRFPEKEDEIMRMQGNMRDDLFTFLPQQRIFQSQNLLAYTEYWEQDWEEVQCIINPFTLQEIEINKTNKDVLRPLLNAPGIKSYKKQKQRVKWTALLNNEIVAEDYNPYNLNEYPFVPVVCTYQPEYDLYQYKLQGLIRPGRDTQIEFNKRISKLTDHMDSQINTGWIIKKSKFDNFNDFYKTGSGRTIFAKNEADLMADARQIVPTPVPQGIFEFQQLLQQLAMRITSVNEELLGSAVDEKAGVLSMLRQGAGLVGLQDIMDNIRYAQEICGNKSLKMMMANWTPEKVFLVTGKQPTQEFYDKNFGKYHAVCVPGSLTETQQQLFFQQLMTFKEMGGPVPWKTILKALPMQGKTELLQDIEQEEQQQAQQAQMAMQMEMQDKRTINQLLMAESKMKIASSHEKIAAAEKDRAMAIYDRAKAAKEMQSIDMDNINKFIDSLIKLEQAEVPSYQQLEEKEDVKDVERVSAASPQ